MKPDASGHVHLAARLRQDLDSGKLNPEDCPHVQDVQDVTASADGCEDCLKTGDKWFHLRICLTCGHVGCCDQSKNRHATAHFKATGHPMIASIEPADHWIWCYVDEAGFPV